MAQASEAGPEPISNRRVDVRPLKRRELGLSLVAGLATLVLSTLFLGPWPDLLGDEARRMGQFWWYVEFFKSFVPPGLAFVATLGIILRLQRRTRTADRETGH